MASRHLLRSNRDDRTPFWRSSLQGSQCNRLGVARQKYWRWAHQKGANGKVRMARLHRSCANPP